MPGNSDETEVRLVSPYQFKGKTEGPMRVSSGETEMFLVSPYQFKGKTRGPRRVSSGENEGRFADPHPWLMDDNTDLWLERPA